MRSQISSVFVVLLSLILVSGCTNGGANKTKDPSNKEGESSSHNHSGGKKEYHVHIHGPHGGECREIPGLDITLECVTKPDQQLCEFYFVKDPAGTKEILTVACEKLTASIKGKGDPTVIEIPATDLKEGKASKFELQDAKLSMALETAGFDIDFVLDGKTYQFFIPKDPH